jgi:hypothetical protein
MRDTYEEGIQIVRVVMTDNLIHGEPAAQLWGAAVPREEAVLAVRKLIPAHWTAELSAQHLAPEHVARLKLEPGDVRELSSVA